MKRLITFCALVLLASAATADDKDKNNNHGQVVSECNHRANERNLQGDDRKDWVDWCVDRGELHGYRDDDWNRERGCYRSADTRGLKGDERREYLNRCLANAGKLKSGKYDDKYEKKYDQDDKYDDDKYDDKHEGEKHEGAKGEDKGNSKKG